MKHSRKSLHFIWIGLLSSTGYGQTVTPFAITTAGGDTLACTLTSVAAAPVTPPVSTPVVSSGAQKKIAALYGFGDSFMYGAGATDVTSTSFFALASKSVPSVPAHDYGQGGATSDPIANSAFTNFVPDPSTPSVTLLDSGANDGLSDSCGGGIATPCVQNYINTMMAAEAWTTIPTQYRIMASAAAQTGPWAPPNKYQITAVPLSPTIPGAALEVSTTGASLTFAIPSSWDTAYLGLNYVPVNAQTGTFTVIIDGLPQIDNCSGTTTFSSGPCSGQNVAQVQRTVFRQEFPVTQGVAHNVVVRTMNSANVGILGVDGVPPAGTANENAVFVSGVTANFPFAIATYDVASHTVADHLRAEGLNVFFVDVEHGTPGINITTDMSGTNTATCVATTTAGHPSDCGHLHWYQTLLAAETAYNYVFHP